MVNVSCTAALMTLTHEVKADAENFDLKAKTKDPIIEAKAEELCLEDSNTEYR